jgi:hypothetical protein
MHVQQQRTAADYLDELAGARGGSAAATPTSSESTTAAAPLSERNGAALMTRN